MERPTSNVESQTSQTLDVSRSTFGGLLLVDKPKGISSFDVIRRLRRITGVRKIGHAGTLDPLATGLMLMLFGDACKQAGLLSKLDKVYRAEVTLGAESSTGDSEGMLTPVHDRVPTEREVKKALKKFQGKITQTPPVYSAIKIDGREAYKRVRAGENVEMPKREVTVYDIALEEYAYPKFKIECEVSSGTYIRTLAQDIGRELGTGAYLSDLVRTDIGNFSIFNAIDLETATAEEVEQKLRPLAAAKV